MANSDDLDDQAVILDGVDDSVDANADAPRIVPSSQFARIEWAGVISQANDGRIYTGPD
jgi:hypothetical protein